LKVPTEGTRRICRSKLIILGRFDQFSSAETCSLKN